ncbi:hypothetical protein [Candidatus Enterovibrio altilux]|uniref:Uncharacterized protein n=1 Tax=Candidatus Enterovibrio altilux TaxID=1927128 RepID=A0A291B9P7_9GAMM|nr:hypothetical protein [Candidatus Enterovibrio luxaltus]ATF09739.1 hypothetical protein BTN50_1253 [Candidatus Enterovibrio luxaltus]
MVKRGVLMLLRGRQKLINSVCYACLAGIIMPPLLMHQQANQND